MYIDENDNVVGGVAQVKFRLQTLESAKRLMREYAELEYYRQERSTNLGFEHLIGVNKRYLELKKEGLKAAKTDFSVLITGETGTGKEVFARAIHSSSMRAEKLLVCVNCAAIPPELLESELFGYEEGAFTGAKKGGKKGKFQVANGGTIFLDEIGDMPLHMQAKILRVLQDGEVDPIGSIKPEPVDIRVIAATKKNLSEMVAQGEFREDLYYRLNVINIELIPLRERPEDVSELANYFLYLLNQKYKQSVVLSSNARFFLSNYQWPGNVRELDNVIKAAYASCDGFTIETIDLPERITHTGSLIKTDNGSPKTLPEMMDEYESQIIKTTLRLTQGNCLQTAKVLGINRSSLYKKMERLKIRKHKEIIFE